VRLGGNDGALSRLDAAMVFLLLLEGGVLDDERTVLAGFREAQLESIVEEESDRVVQVLLITL
jgi:hypothetical protein